ncbi:MAG TPA: hypothetical protein PLS50_07455, partial [Candidatus Dojkabacteria bacterium]|nr:hypothetical protein [Candidatus Dojkabacteria bacterium]
NHTFAYCNIEQWCSIHGTSNHDLSRCPIFISNGRQMDPSIDLVFKHRGSVNTASIDVDELATKVLIHIQEFKKKPKRSNSF